VLGRASGEGGARKTAHMDTIRAVDDANEPSHLVLNSSGKGSALHRYAVHLRSALGPRASLVSLAMSTAQDLGHDGERPLFGTRTGWYTLDVVTNSLAPRIAFPGLRRMLDQARRTGSTVHVASLDVPSIPIATVASVTIHDDPQAYFSTELYAARSRYKALQRLRLRHYREAPIILATSQHVAAGLATYGITRGVRVVYPPVDPAFRSLSARSGLRNQLALPEGTRLLLSVSSAEPRKNLAAVRRTMDRLGSAFRLVRVGPPLEGSINFGRVPDEDLVKLFNACDALLFPSLEEGFGSPVAEALTVGLPVVASDIPIMREVTAGAAILTDPSDERALARSVTEALERREELAAKGALRARAFSFAAFAETIRTLWPDAN
jgi:glycosyltransferase involved in cell wall biosynthesis